MCSIDNEERKDDQQWWNSATNKLPIKGLKEGTSYKFFGVIQADGTKHHEMKEKVKTQYRWGVRKILETKLNGGNIITRANTYTFSLLRYSAAFLDWTGAELEQMENKKINDNALGIES